MMILLESERPKAGGTVLKFFAKNRSESLLHIFYLVTIADDTSS